MTFLPALRTSLLLVAGLAVVIVVGATVGLTTDRDCLATPMGAMTGAATVLLVIYVLLLLADRRRERRRQDEARLDGLEPLRRGGSGQ